jgi:hypothetical protein
MGTGWRSEESWPKVILGHRAPGQVLTKSEMRASKPTRDEFVGMPRRPLTVVLDRVSGNYNIGAIFRLCDTFLVERLVICGALGHESSSSLPTITAMNPPFELAAVQTTGASSPVDPAGLNNKIRSVSIPRQSRGLNKGAAQSGCLTSPRPNCLKQTL